MDSTAVYDSGNAGDSESWSSSEGEEQVIEISSHSRILISPRKARPSAWDEKLKRTSRRRLSTGKRKVGRAEQIVSESPRSRASRYSVQEPKSGKSCWIRSPRKTPADNQPASSNNRGDISQSESESDESFGSGQKGSEESSSDSDASLEAEWESPVLRRTLRRQRPKVPQKSNRGFNLLAADSIRSLDSSTPGKEMEELKATLKKLAGHDGNHDNPLMEKALNISSATALHEYLTAATALGGVHAADQIRPTEYPGSKPRHKSFNAGSYVSTAPTRTKSTSMLENNSYESGNFGDTTKNPARNDRLTLNKKLFSTPPPPFAGAGKYAAGLAFPVPTSSNPSAGGGSSGAQGSRAVLSALKALQDKIVRLEEERETLKQQLSDTKLTVRKREAELAASEKKFSYELGQTKESARAAYDALRCDREELKLQLVKSEERRKAIQVELQHFQELTKTLSEKTDDLQARLQISESHRSRLKAEMKDSENEHKRVVNDLQTELSQVRQEQQASAERNELLEAQFQRESSNHAESRERLKEVEETVASISQLNEKLVGKVMEATETANQAIKKNKKLQQQIRPSTLLRPTAASRASAAAASEANSRRASNSTASARSSGASPSRTLKKKKTSTGAASSTTKKTKRTKGTDNMTLLREANLGKEVPFLLGSSVQSSFSLIGNVQDALRRSDTTYVMPTLLSETRATQSQASMARNSHPTTPSRADNYSLEKEADTVQLPPEPASPQPLSQQQTIAHDAGIGGEKISSTPEPSARSTRRTKTKPPAIKVPTVSPKTYVSPMQSQIMEDLNTAVEAAEKEFKVLNTRYKDLVAQMEANNRRGAAGTEAGGSINSVQLSQALGPLLDELEAKAKQLNLLKQVYQQAANSTINPPRHVVVSPEAVRRKTASLRLLNEYRQLESDIKNKGSGRSASPSSHLRANGFFH